jgi:hypothetical protein
MKNLVVFLAFCSFAAFLPAQPTIEWQKSFGGYDSDEIHSIQQTNDGGYIATGYTYSNDGDISGYHGYGDFWVVKMSSSGVLEWQKALGGSDLDWPFAIRQTQDGGFIVAGYTRSTDGDVSGSHGDKDAWVVKLTSSGNIEWQKALGGSGWDDAWSVAVTADGGYIMAGRTNSSNGDASGSHNGSLDFWVVKLSSTGVIQWQKALGGSNEDTAKSIRQTSDGGYIIAGETSSNDGDVSGSIGNVDVWVVKLSSEGELEWQKPLGGSNWDVGSDIHETSDGFFVCGYVGSNDGDVTGYQGLFDFWVLKLSKTGELLWQKTLGGSDADWGYAGTPSTDGGYVVAGTTRSNNGDVLYNDGGQDIWIVKLDNNGALVWQQILGGSKAESGNSIDRTNDGGFVVAGRSSSNDGDATFNQGAQDFWVVKLSPESVATHEAHNAQTSRMEIFPNPAWQLFTVNTSSEAAMLHVTVSDLLGREVLHQTIQNGGNISASALPNGLYLVVAKEQSGRVFTGTLRKEE